MASPLVASSGGSTAGSLELLKRMPRHQDEVQGLPREAPPHSIFYMDISI